MPIARFWTLLLLLATLLIPNLSAALQPGEPFPAVTGETLDGSNFDLASLKGKPILIKIGTTWCGTCQEQARTINGIRGFLQDKGIHYVEVFIQESAEKVRGYLDEGGQPQADSVILDDGDISRQLNVYVIPRVILLDRDLKVFRDGDVLSASALKQKLQELLDKT